MRQDMWQYTLDSPNTETIKKLQCPTNIKQLQQYLGFININKKFIKLLSLKLTYPLKNLLRKNVLLVWDSQCESPFQIPKNAFIIKSTLKLYNTKIPCYLLLDASSHKLGCVLKQEDENGILQQRSAQAHTWQMRGEFSNGLG